MKSSKGKYTTSFTKPPKYAIHHWSKTNVPTVVDCKQTGTAAAELYLGYLFLTVLGCFYLFSVFQLRNATQSKDFSQDSFGVLSRGILQSASAVFVVHFALALKINRHLSHTNQHHNQGNTKLYFSVLSTNKQLCFS